MSIYQQLRNQWPWNPTYLQLYRLLPLFMSLLLVLIFFNQLQLYASLFLLLIPIGVLLHTIYSSVERRVDVLRHCKSAQNGEVADSMMMLGQQPSPGVAILRDTVLVLIPIEGRRRKLQLADIASVQESHKLAGKFVWGKHIFQLTTQHGKTLTFAVAKTIGNRWSKVLNHD